MVLNKRIPRDFKENLIKYIGLMLLCIITSMVVVGFVNSSDSVIKTGAAAALNNNQEDGNFEVESKLNNATIQKLKDLGITINENFFIDYELDTNKKIRLFKQRIDINKLSIVQGNNLNSSSKQILLNKHFASKNNYNIDGNLKIDNKIYKICGYVAAPDYTLVLEKLSDVIANPSTFGIAFISNEDFNSLKDTVTYSYSFKLNGISADTLKSILINNANLTLFVQASDNQRITSYINDSLTSKSIAIAIGCALFIMISFIISMSLINNIDSESPIIGALYSLGYIKKEILNHFMILPILLVGIGSIIGTMLGFILSSSLQKSTTEYYSLPIIHKVYTLSLLFVGIILPILIVIVVNYIILSKRLNSTPLQLLRKEKGQDKLNTIKINHFDFVTKYRIREFLREIRGNITLFFGIMISTFLLIFGLGCNGAIKNYIENLSSDTEFKYTYMLKLPIEVTENENVEKTTIKGLSMYYDGLDQNMDITLQGIKEDSNFYNFNIKDTNNGVYISDTLSKKFNVKQGDILNLKDTAENKVYRLKISGIVKYSTGLYIFMNQKHLNLLLDESKSYFNAYLSNNKLNINTDYIYSLISSDNIIDSGKSMTSMMLPMISMLIIISSILFIISMYLLLKLMIDKSTSSISLVKIFGFSTKEINKLYLGSSLYTVIVSAIISIPLCINITELLWPSLIANIQSFFPISLGIKDYIFMFIIILGSYFISNSFLKRHVNKIQLAEALKNRD